MRMHLRKAASLLAPLLLAPLLLAGAGVAGVAGSAHAADLCAGPNLEAVSITRGATVCWYGGNGVATAKICDTASDGNTPYLAIEAYASWIGWYWNYLYDDPYGAGGCVWAYPSSSYETNGDIIFMAANLTSTGTVLYTGIAYQASW